jgi:hypothetical protein
VALKVIILFSKRKKENFDILLEYVVLIPLQKTSTLNIVLFERRQVDDITDKNILHIGSGRNGDFIIYKNSQPGKYLVE